MARLYGDPEKLARKALEPSYEEAVRLLEEAFEASKRLINEALENSLKEAEKSVMSKAETLRERLAGFRSKMDLEVKSAVAKEKNEYASSVIEEAISRFREAKKRSEAYKGFLERTLRSVMEEASGQNVVVLASSDDMETIKEIVEKLGVINVSVHPDDRILGGFIAEIRGAGVKLDYTINNILTTEDARLRRVAIRALFGE